MHDRLLILWLALLGATRIDFLAGSGPLILTPFLVLSPFVVGSEVWRGLRERRELRLPPGANGFVLAVSALLLLLLVSVFASQEPAVSARRFALLFAQVTAVVVIGLALAARPNAGRLLLRGAYAGLALCLLFSAVQLALWLIGPSAPDTLAGVVELEARNYAGVVPRLTGVSHDANLGGMLVLFYLAVIALLEPPSTRRRWAVGMGAALIALTLSRSVVLAALALWVATAARGWTPRVTARLAGAGAAIVGAVVALYLASPGTLEPFVEVGAVLGQRLTPGEGAAVERAGLLVRGWEVGTESVRHVLVGMGYGSAFLVLQDVFPGNEYGNFHSWFVTLFAESGAPATLVAFGIFWQTFRRGGDYRPLVAALFVFSVFQQAHTEPYLWLALLLAWREGDLA